MDRMDGTVGRDQQGENTFSTKFSLKTGWTEAKQDPEELYITIISCRKLESEKTRASKTKETYIKMI